MTARRMSVLDWSELLLLSALWAATFVFAKIALTQIAPLTLALGRVGLAALLLRLALRLAGVASPCASPASRRRAGPRSGARSPSWASSTTPCPSV